ncbi:MAG: S-layer protein, partial [Planctomycetaceae bacterium]
MRDLLTILACLLLAPSTPAADPPTRSLQVSPNPIVLGGSNRVQQIQVTAIGSDGRHFDVTHQATLETTDRHTAALDETVLSAVSDGTTRLMVSYGGQRIDVVVRVVDRDTVPPVHFKNDIMPMLSKLGCNSGGCHGKQGGQNGFKLSVFGFDPPADYNALVKEARGRRVSLAAPGGSLLVGKSSNTIAHGGGARTGTGSADHQLLANWVAQGAPWGDDDAAQVVSIRVFPEQRVLRTDDDQQLLVTAVFTDGSTRDVTTAAEYTSNATLVADIEDAGHVHTGNVPGEVAITINYMGHVAAARITVPLDNN